MGPTLSRRTRTVGLAALVMITVGLGCQSKLFSYEGKTANQKDNVSLREGGPHSGRWESGDVIVNYTYDNSANSFQIEGTVELTPRLTKSFRDVSNFSVRANLLGEDRIILKSVTIVIAGNQPITTWRFKEAFPAPTGASAMNFSYRGTAYESSGGALMRGGDRIDASFWKEP